MKLCDLWENDHDIRVVKNDESSLRIKIRNKWSTTGQIGRIYI